MENKSLERKISLSRPTRKKDAQMDFCIALLLDYP
jgi:hypothetical protein